MTPRTLVVDLRSRAAAFRMPDAVGAQLAAATPAGWATTIVAADTDSFGDGAQTPSEESLAAIGDAEAYLGYGLPKPLFFAAKRLRWLHTATAGVASLLFPEMLASEIVITNSAGVFGPPIADHVLAGVLHFLRAFDVAEELKRRVEWNSSAFGTREARVREVSECRVLIVGTGGIGGEVGRRFGALGARVTGVRRDPAKGTPPGFDRVVGPTGLDAELARADVVVLAAPFTGETRALLTAARLARLPDGAIVCNVSRGGLVDEPALTAALQTGRLRGAVLDVFAREPLASDSPLWHLPRVLHTPHVAGVSPGRFWERLVGLFLDNWERYRTGTPLRNVVDKSLGY
ncbi:MAG TPA: D-2-hydroxyacid dehydrogenase [Gemmatimonadaceae bacterium]|uniref:Putative oxidoreductase n=1 Tax=uncultured Gemmatimonadetes bacterium Rifle_16ft_4_minimus_37772 TaxID=1665097 RepID=A0A0H4T527_9BACT|nr:putative oxidoreductase [uncultured Gemmatimonadetes bacterium Rifle_16ft_4_minimus_37772]HLA90106.1 D-2-hydroxyacid dehydrogenase [Gemmatimonadaceae bacterium]